MTSSCLTNGRADAAFNLSIKAMKNGRFRIKRLAATTSISKIQKEERILKNKISR